MNNKIYRLSETDWFAAPDRISAIKCQKKYLNQMFEGDDYKAELKCVAKYWDDPPLDDSELDRLMFTCEEGSKPFKRSFKKQLKFLEETGEIFPCLFATTEY